MTKDDKKAEAKDAPTEPKATKEPKKSPWQYVGKFPTRAAGRLIHPGNVVMAEKKPGANFRPYKKPKAK